MAKQPRKIKLVRITTVPISLRMLITDQPAYMNKAGFDVILVSSEGQDWNFIPNLYQYKVHKLNMARQISVVQDILSLLKLIFLFIRIRPDVVHSHTPKAGLLAMWAAKLTGVPVRVHTLAGLPAFTATGLKKKILLVAERLTFAATNETWPNSKKLLNYILREKLIDEKKAKMILEGSSNGIDISRYSLYAVSRQRLKEIAAKHGIDESNFCFLAVGRMVNDKGIKELVNAFVALHTSNDRLRLLLLGPFETADALPAEVVNTIKKHAAIKHVDWSDEVDHYMALSNCFVHASHREGFPNVVLQAGAMGTPIVCSDIPGNTDIVETEAEGYLFKVKDEAELRAKMLEVLKDYNTALGKAALLKEKVVKNYDRRAVHGAIKQRYIELLKQKGIDVSTLV